MFSIVQFEDKTTAVVRDDWIESENSVRFPKNNVTKFAQSSKTSRKTIAKWKLSNVSFIKRNINSYETAATKLKIMSEDGDTDEQETNARRKQIKRHHPVAYKSAQVDLNHQLNVAKASVQSAQQEAQGLIEEVEAQNVSEFPHVSDDEGDHVQVTEATGSIREEDGTEQDQIVEEFFITQTGERLYRESEMKMVVDKAVKEVKEFFNDRFDKLEKRLFPAPGTSFEKISSKEELIEFSEKLSDKSYMNKISEELKLTGNSGRHHSEKYRRMSSMLEYLFEHNFLKKIRWGESSMSKHEVEFFLCEYANIVALFKLAMSSKVNGALQVPDTDEIKRAIQNHYRHHMK